MSWNYRVIRHEDDTGISYTVHECHYDQKGETIPSSWTKEPAIVMAETRDGLLWVLSVMAEAIEHPVLEVKDGKLCEVESKREFADEIKSVLAIGKLVGTGDYDSSNPPRQRALSEIGRPKNG